MIPFPRTGKRAAMLAFPRTGKRASLIAMPRTGKRASLIAMPRTGKRLWAPRTGKRASLIAMPRTGKRSPMFHAFERIERSNELDDEPSLSDESSLPSIHAADYAENIDGYNPHTDLIGEYDEGFLPFKHEKKWYHFHHDGNEKKSNTHEEDKNMSDTVDSIMGPKRPFTGLFDLKPENAGRHINGSTLPIFIPPECFYMRNYSNNYSKYLQCRYKVSL